jgi:hypothetical protein
VGEAAHTGLLAGHTSELATVDPADDNIQRYVVRHYAHNAERHERRHQVVVAFDNEREFLRLLERLNADLERRREVSVYPPLDVYPPLLSSAATNRSAVTARRSMLSGCSSSRVVAPPRWLSLGARCTRLAGGGYGVITTSAQDIRCAACAGSLRGHVSRLGHI